MIKKIIFTLVVGVFFAQPLQAGKVLSKLNKRDYVAATAIVGLAAGWLAAEGRADDLQQDVATLNVVRDDLYKQLDDLLSAHNQRVQQINSLEEVCAMRKSEIDALQQQLVEYKTMFPAKLADLLCQWGIVLEEQPAANLKAALEAKRSLLMQQNPAELSLEDLLATLDFEVVVQQASASASESAADDAEQDVPTAEDEKQSEADEESSSPHLSRNKSCVVM